MKQTLSCFVVSPIGADNSPERLAANQVLRKLMRPALGALGYKVSRIDELMQPGDINQNIVEQLATSDLVVADLNGFNPNVMYEVGIRQAWNRPIIFLCPKHTKLPFDLYGQNTVFYPDQLLQGRQPSRATLKAIKSIRKLVNKLAKPQRKTPFEFALNRITSARSLCLVYEAKRATLMHLSEGLREFRNELRKDFEANADHLGRLFSNKCQSLRERATVLDFVVKCVESKLNKWVTFQCKKVCEEMLRLQSSADRLQKQLEEFAKGRSNGRQLKKSAHEALTRIETRIDEIKSKIEKILLELGG